MLDFISPDPVALHARLRPEALAAVDLATGRRWRYRDLDRDVQRAVAVLTRDGVTRGDRVAALARNSVHQVVLQQALMRIGAIFVPLNWRLSLPELARLLLDCTPRLLVADQTLPELPPGCRAMPMAAFTAAAWTRMSGQ
jgi:fatty-acyl-CoA synthase